MNRNERLQQLSMLLTAQQQFELLADQSVGGGNYGYSPRYHHQARLFRQPRQ